MMVAMKLGRVVVLPALLAVTALAFAFPSSSLRIQTSRLWVTEAKEEEERKLKFLEGLAEWRFTEE